MNDPVGSSSRPIDRRDLLKSTAIVAAAGMSQSAGTQASIDSVVSAANNIITEENKRRGTTDWQLTRVRPNASAYRTSLIEGYCSHQSVAAGEKLTVFVSTDPARQFQLDVYRMGYYGGTGGSLKATYGPLNATPQPVPDIGPAPGRLRECRWKPSVEFTIPDDWVSGVYLGKLTTLPESSHEPYWQSYVIFIVRDKRKADFLFQCSDNTWHAYNRWPVNESLYTHPAGSHAPGVAVSFDRPYGKYNQIFDHPLSVGSGEFLLWEFPLAYWMEQHGYDVTYGSNLDSCNLEFIQRCRSFLSVGHDEYWDLRQYAAVESAIENGTHVLWLCGNSVFVDSPFSDSSTGQPGRIITRRGCFGELRSRELEFASKMYAGLKSTGPDERRIMGVRNVYPYNGGGDWTCINPEHWLFKGTGMKQGDSIPGLVGWEHHGDPDPNQSGLEVLAAGPIWSGGTNEGRYESVMFRGPENNIVFNASTIFWAQGLSSPPGHIIPWSHFSRPHGPDARVQTMTRNLFDATLK
jgi:hypothetical protein